nr:MAG TPA: hypothetical protein [Caudoviricetes sp.]
MYQPRASQYASETVKTFLRFTFSRLHHNIAVLAFDCIPCYGFSFSLCALYAA